MSDGWQCFWFDALDSTQIWLSERAQDLPSRCCVTALRQTAGLGRQQRRWASEAGGLYASLLLKPDRLLPELPWALWWALLEALERETGLTIELKAPNDLLLQGRKLAGQLIDSKLLGTYPQYYLCGFGINLNQTVFSAELAESAISLYQATGRTWPLETMLETVLACFDARLSLLGTDRFGPALLEALGKRSVRISYNGPESISLEEYWHVRG